MAKKLKINKGHPLYKLKKAKRENDKRVKIFQAINDEDQLNFLGNIKHKIGADWDLTKRRDRVDCYRATLNARLVYDQRLEDFHNLPAKERLKFWEMEQKSRLMKRLNKEERAEVERLKTLAEAEEIIENGRERGVSV